MGKLNDLMSLFRNAPTNNIGGAQIPGQSPGQTIVVQQATLPTTKTAAELAAEAAAKEPLAAFKDLFTLPTGKDATIPVDPLAFNTDPKKIQQVAAQQDFTKSLPAELVQKMKDGGDGAVMAMLTAMNAIAQNAASFGLQASTAVTEKAIQHTRNVVGQDISSGIKAQAVADAMSLNNPLASNPATAPLFKMVQENLARANPNATPAELAQLANEYTQQVNTVLNSHPGAQSNNSGDGQLARRSTTVSDDFSSFLQ